MPRVINGIGTWYWGKTNIRSRRGVCPFCQRSTQLRSYNTTRFFVVFWVPLISLGERRIIEECQLCKRHRVISLKQFEKLKAEAVSGALDAFRAAPNDVAKCADVIGKAVGFEAEEQFVEAAQLAERSLANNGEIQGRLGAAYVFFGMPQEAEAAYLRALRIAPDDQTRGLLAILYMREGRTDEALPLVKPLLQQKLRDQVGIAYLLAEAYQAQGRHDDALGILHQIAGAFPGIENDAEFTKYRNLSTARRTSGKPVPSVNLTPLSMRVAEHRPLAASIPRLIGPALALLAVGIYLGVALWEGHSRRIWFVNGLDRAYDVDVDGRRVHLPALGHVAVNLPEGRSTVAFADSSIPLPPQTFEVNTPFVSRPFEKRSFVVNPDRAALIYTIQTTYSASTSALGLGSSEAPHRLYVGDLFYSFSNIDYPFSAFPKSIELPNRNEAVSKTQLENLSSGSAFDRLSILSKELGNDAVTTYVKNYALCNAGDSRFVLIASALLPPDQAIEFLRPRLDAKPVQVEWHRAYQELIERVHPELDLVKEYQARLDRDPSDPSLMYLLGRVTPDRKEATRWFEKAAHGNPPSPFAFYAMAYDAMASADYARALDLCREAMRLAPADEEFRTTESEAMLALGQYEPLLARAAEQQAKSPHDASVVLLELKLLTLLHRPEQARSAAAEFISKHIEEGSIVQWQANEEAIVQYIEGDMSGFVRSAASGATDPMIKFQAAVASGKLDDAAKLAASLEGFPDQAHLILYILGAANGQKEFADRELAAALDLLRKEGRAQRRAAKLLADIPTDPAVGLAVNLLPEQKRLILVALGLKDPVHRQTYFKAAVNFNYDRSFPYWQLKKLIDGTAGK